MTGSSTGPSEITLDNWALEKVGQLLPREVTIRLLPTAVIVAALKKELCEGRYNDPVKVGQALNVLREIFPEDGVAFRAMLMKEIWPAFKHPEVMRQILDGWFLQRWVNVPSTLSPAEREKLTYSNIAEMNRGGFLLVGPDAAACYTFFITAHAAISEDKERIPLLHVLREQCLKNMRLGATPRDLTSWGIREYAGTTVHITDVAQVILGAATSSVDTEWLTQLLAIMPLRTQTGRKVLRALYAQIARAEEIGYAYITKVQPFACTEDGLYSRDNPNTPFEKDARVNSFDVYVCALDTIEVAIRMRTRINTKTLEGLRVARDVIVGKQKVNLRVRISMPGDAHADRPEVLTL